MNFNKVCELEDFADPELAAVIRDVAAYKLADLPQLPRGAEHRKDWEVAMAVRALRHHGALRPDATLLGVAAGIEDTIFYLTRHAARVFATDRYAMAGEWLPMAPISMLVDPQSVAPFDFDVNRLVVQHMDARALRYPDDSFDGVFSSGSIEHVGELTDVGNVAYEMGRVLKPGGVMSLSTELRLDGPPGGIGWPGRTLMFPPDLLRRYVVEASGLELVDDLQVDVTDATMATLRDLAGALKDHADRSAEGRPEHLAWDFPYVALSHDGYLFTSVHLTLVKTDRYPAVDNRWAKPGPAVLEAISEDNKAAVSSDRADLLAEMDAWKDAHRTLQLERVALEAERDSWQEAHREMLIERVGLTAERDALIAQREELLENKRKAIEALSHERDLLAADRDRMGTELTVLAGTRTFRLRAWALDRLSRSRRKPD